MAHAPPLGGRERVAKLSQLFTSWFLSNSKALFQFSALQLNRYPDVFTTTVKGRVKCNNDGSFRAQCNITLPL